MDKYVKLADLEKYAKAAERMGLPLEKTGEYLLKFAQAQATDEVAKIVRCRDCTPLPAERQCSSCACR